MSIMEYKNDDYRFLITLRNKDEKNEKKFNEILENLEIFLYSSFDSNNINNNSSGSINRINSDIKKNVSNIKNKGKDKNKNDKGQNTICLFNSIKYCNGYLKMKQLNYLNGSRIDNWLIFVTCGMTDKEIDEIIQKPINETLFPNEENNSNLIIIFYDNISKEIKRKLKKWMHFNKSTVLIKDELVKLKEIMGTKGEQQKIIFEFEKYKDNN